MVAPPVGSCKRKSVSDTDDTEPLARNVRQCRSNAIATESSRVCSSDATDYHFKILGALPIEFDLYLETVWKIIDISKYEEKLIKLEQDLEEGLIGDLVKSLFRVGVEEQKVNQSVPVPRAAVRDRYFRHVASRIRNADVLNGALQSIIDAAEENYGLSLNGDERQQLNKSLASVNDASDSLPPQQPNGTLPSEPVTITEQENTKDTTAINESDDQSLSTSIRVKLPSHVPAKDNALAQMSVLMHDRNILLLEKAYISPATSNCTHDDDDTLEDARRCTRDDRPSPNLHGNLTELALHRSIGSTNVTKQSDYDNSKLHIKPEQSAEDCDPNQSGDKDLKWPDALSSCEPKDNDFSNTPIVDCLWDRSLPIALTNRNTVIQAILSNIQNRASQGSFEDVLDSETKLCSNGGHKYDSRGRWPSRTSVDPITRLSGRLNGPFGNKSCTFSTSRIRPLLEAILRPFVLANEDKFQDLPDYVFPARGQPDPSTASRSYDRQPDPSIASRSYDSYRPAYSESGRLDFEDRYRPPYNNQNVSEDQFRIQGKSRLGLYDSIKAE